MSRKEIDKETEQLRTKLLEAMNQLQPHHLAWCIDWALKNVTEELRRYEQEELEHEAAIAANSLTYPTTSHFEPRKDRKERVRELQQRWIPEYRAVHEFLCAMAKYTGHVDTVNFAEAIAQQWKRESR